MPVQVISLRPGNSVWPYSLPATQGGFQYYMQGAFLARGDTAAVPTLREFQRTIKAMQKQIDSLQKEVVRLKTKNASTKKRR